MSDDLVLVHNTLPKPMVEGKSERRIGKKYNNRNHVWHWMACVDDVSRASRNSLHLLWEEKACVTLGLASRAKDSRVD